jgi:hypothetical protein
MKKLLTILSLFLSVFAYTQTNTCEGTFTFGSGPCQKIIIGNGTPGQVRICLNVKQIPVGTGGNNCNPGGGCNPPYNGGGWAPRVAIWNSNADGTNYVSTTPLVDWISNTTVGTCYTVTLTTGYAVLFGLCNINGTQISWTTVDNNGVNMCSALPVELISFEVTPTPQGNLLTWKTASEHNSDYYLLERSVTGEFTEKSIIQVVTAAGNSTELLTYSRIDNSFERGVNYYQLTQVDIDGQFKTYGPIAIDNTLTNKTLIKTVNLLGQEINYDYRGVIIEVYDDGTTTLNYR